MTARSPTFFAKPCRLGLGPQRIQAHQSLDTTEHQVQAFAASLVAQPRSSLPTVHLSHRMPFGFHGDWVNGAV